MAEKPRTPGALDGVEDLGALVGYQPGAVVSRTLIKKPTGTVTAFAFDAGEGLSEHTAAFDALVIGIEGAATFTIAGTDHTVQQGQLLLLPAGRPHALRTTAQFKMLLVMIRELQPPEKPRGFVQGIDTEVERERDRK